MEGHILAALNAPTPPSAHRIRKRLDGVKDNDTPPTKDPVPMTLPKDVHVVALLCASLLLGGCIAGGNVRKPIPTAYYPAPLPAQRLVVMLPGRGDTLKGLEDHRVAQIIQAQWPHADVILTGLSMPYYRQGRVPQRLHDEVVAPALARHPLPLWVGGISLGGLGTLLYDHAYPGQAKGLLLLSPYLGDAAIHKEIRRAGGLAAWKPGPWQPMEPKTFQRELWRYIKHWRDDPQRACTVWVAYGDSERFRDSIELMAPLLPADHVMMRPGHHDWALWTPALKALVKRADAAQACR